jgi:carboxyl-terminal processing protease
MWPSVTGLCYGYRLLSGEVPLVPFFRLALPRAAAALVAASMVVSCATSTDTPQAESGKAAVAADVNIERVVLQAYRAIGDPLM